MYTKQALGKKGIKNKFTISVISLKFTSQTRRPTMIFLNTTYVSPLLEQTLLENNVAIYDTQRHIFLKTTQGQKIAILNSEDAFSAYKMHFPDTKTTKLAELLKNKVSFRKHLATNQSGFFFREITFAELQTIDAYAFSYPIIIKPAIGYSSLGVYRINHADHFKQIYENLKETMLLTMDLSHLNEQLFLIESFIPGQEFAIDMYYNQELEPVVLNVFTRLFKDAHDMSDRIYYTSKETLESYLAPITEYLTKLRTIFQIEEPLPLHIELRIDGSGKIMPIEINPLRFAGEGTTELGHFAYNVNPYDYFFNNKQPNWQALLEQMDDAIYCFTCAVLDTPLSDAFEIDHSELKKHFPQLLEYRHLPKEVGTTFAVIFYKCDTLEALQPILTLDFNAFLTLKQQGVTYAKK